MHHRLALLHQHRLRTNGLRWCVWREQRQFDLLCGPAINAEQQQPGTVGGEQGEQHLRTIKRCNTADPPC